MQDEDYAVAVSFDQIGETVILIEQGSFGEMVFLSVDEAIGLSEHLMNVEAYLSDLDRPTSPERLSFDVGTVYLAVGVDDNGGKYIAVGDRDSFGSIISIQRDAAQEIGEHFALSEDFLQHLRSRVNFQ